MSRILECEYIVVNNDQEKEIAETYFKGRKNISYPYPFSIGCELGFLFYVNKTKIEDYYDEDEKRTYTYNKIDINSI